MESIIITRTRFIPANHTENLCVPAESTACTVMAPGPNHSLPGLLCSCLTCTGQPTSSDPSPSSSPLDQHTVSARTTSTQPLPSTPLVPVTASAPHVEVSPAIGALKTALGTLQTSLGGLPLKPAVDGLLECVVHLQVEERNRESFEQLASQLSNVVNLLQRHPVASNQQNMPYSIEFIIRCISEQTKVIKTYQDRARISRLAMALEDQEIVLEGYHRICTLFQQLQADVSLSIWDTLQRQQMDARIERLCPVHDARYNAALPTTIAKRVSCTKNTRVKLLEGAMAWAGDSNAAKINWLNGMAGTGKTTIAYTICQRLHADRRLAASYFCSRNSPGCRDVRNIVPTIAYQLGRYSIPYKKAVCDVLEEDPDVAKSDISTQFERLILKPLMQIGKAIPDDVVVVIDALDECTDVAGTRDVLNMLIKQVASLHIKFFVASRPEPAISEIMEARGDALRLVIRLHDIEKSLVQADITVYLTEALKSVQVSPLEIDQLAARAGNLFIFAATAVRYILPDTGAVNKRKRLLEVLALQSRQKNRSHRDIDDLYETILSNALDENIYDEEELATMRQVLWTAICAKEPLTIRALSELLNVPDEGVRLMVHPLQSVLHVSGGTSVVSTLHASFPDFLLSKERAGRFHCNEVTQTALLADHCFNAMDRSLRFNICGLESSYVLDNNIPNLQTRVEKAISTGLFYSCIYWSDHLTTSPPSPSLLSLLHAFLQQHLLFWMEVLNLKGRIGHGEIALSQVLTWLPTEGEWAELQDLTYDARNFVTVFTNNPTSLSTPHIYVSTLPFTSEQSHVRKTYWPRTQGLIEIKGGAMEGRSESALATWVVGSDVRSIAQSSGGRRVVSGSENDGVTIWDVSSGARILGPLGSHSGAVMSVAFSPDDSRIASGSSDRTIRVWDAHNGDHVLEPLLGHTSYVCSVAFSCDGTHLASGSGDCTVRMWDPNTGAAIGDAFIGHRDAVRSVAFSPDGEHLASGSEDCTIRVWNWHSGVVTLGPIGGHTKSVNSISYSSNGLCLASGSWDCTVRVWDVISGGLLAGPFEGGTSLVMSVSFSPDGTHVVSGSFDGTMRVWEAMSGKLLSGPFKGSHDAIGAALFSTDGTRILSGSWDGTIRVWDTRHKTAGATEPPGHSGGISSVAMSPDGTCVASGSYDNTICIWDAHNGALVAGPFKGHTESLTSVAFSPDGARIVSGSTDCTLCTWEASTGALLAAPFEGHIRSVTSVTFSPDGSQIASGSWDRTIRLWDSYTGELVAEPLEGHASVVTSIAFPRKGPRIVSSSFDKTVRMWDTNKGTTLWMSDAHTGWVYSVAFSPDGTRVVSSSEDMTILVLSVGDGAVLHSPFTGHTASVLSVAFSPDGRRIVSSSQDRTVRVWDAESGRGTTVIGPLKGHTQSVESVAFSPEGARIVSGSADHTIRFWDVAAAAQPDTTSFDNWSIDNDGWLIDSQSQRLLWVPSDLRDGFWFPTPSDPLVSNARSTTRVDDTTLLGNRWHGCYDTSRGVVSS